MDINLLGNSLETNFLDDNLELFFQEVMMCFNSNMTDFFGHIDFLNLQKYIFSKGLTTGEVNKYVHDYILHNCSMSMSYDWNVETSFLKSQKDNDLLYVCFSVDSNGEKYSTQFIAGIS